MLHYLEKIYTKTLKEIVLSQPLMVFHRVWTFHVVNHKILSSRRVMLKTNDTNRTKFSMTAKVLLCQNYWNKWWFSPAYKFKCTCIICMLIHLHMNAHTLSDALTTTDTHVVFTGFNLSSCPPPPPPPPIKVYSMLNWWSPFTFWCLCGWLIMWG